MRLPGCQVRSYYVQFALVNVPQGGYVQTVNLGGNINDCECMRLASLLVLNDQV